MRHRLGRFVGWIAMLTVCYYCRMTWRPWLRSSLMFTVSHWSTSFRPTAAGNIVASWWPSSETLTKQTIPSPLHLDINLPSILHKRPFRSYHLSLRHHICVISLLCPILSLFPFASVSQLASLHFHMILLLCSLIRFFCWRSSALHPRWNSSSLQFRLLCPSLFAFLKHSARVTVTKRTVVVILSRRFRCSSMYISILFVRTVPVKSQLPTQSQKPHRTIKAAWS